MGCYYFLSSHRKLYFTFDSAKVVYFSDGCKGKTIKRSMIFPIEVGDLESYVASKIETKCFLKQKKERMPSTATSSPF